MRQPPEAGSTRREGMSYRLIRLADGSAWGFALPTVRLRPTVNVDTDEFGRISETIGMEARFGHPLEVESLLGTLRDATETRTAGEQHTAFLALAISLLRRIHDISHEAAGELLRVPCEDLPELVRGVMEVATTGEVPRTTECFGGRM